MKVALVTASSAGLGAAIAKCLAKDMRVVINYSRSADRAEVVQAEMEKIADVTHCCGFEGPRFGIVGADLGKRADIERLVNETISMMGRLDLIVSNGGWTRMRDFTSLRDNVDENDWDKCFNINVKSHLHLLNTAQEYLQLTRGSFITIASVAGVKPSGSSIPYAVTKAAQVHMVKCLAQAVGPSIRINSISPGILMTDWGKQFPEDKLKVARDATVLDRFATVEDVASAVKMLAYNDSITGHNLVIDSGFCI